MRSNLKRNIVIHRKITWLLLFSIVSLAVAYWFIYASKRNIDKNNLRISSTHAIIEKAQACLTSVAETGAITPPLFDSLNRLCRNNNDLTAFLPALHRFFSTQQHGPDVKALLYKMLDEEKRSLAERQQINEKVIKRVTTGMYFGRTGAFLFVFVAKRVAANSTKATFFIRFFKSYLVIEIACRW